MKHSDVGAGRHKLCSNYTNTCPGGDILWENAAIFHLSHTWMIFSLYFTLSLWISDTYKWEFVC